MNIAVFASHGGSDLQAIIDGCKNNQINARVSVVISKELKQKEFLHIILVQINLEMRKPWQRGF